MAHPIQTFAGIMTNPLNVYNFEVKIPGLDTPELTLLIESTTFPTQGKFREISLWYMGQQVRYPGLPENGGTWQFKIPESDNGVVATQFKKLFDAMYDQKSGIMKPIIWKNIDIFQKDTAGNIVYHSILHGCWIAQKNPVNLSASTPGDAWKQDFVFVYQWIEDVQTSNSSGSSSPM